MNSLNLKVACVKRDQRNLDLRSLANATLANSTHTLIPSRPFKVVRAKNDRRYIRRRVLSFSFYPICLSSVNYTDWSAAGEMTVWRCYRTLNYE